MPDSGNQGATLDIIECLSELFVSGEDKAYGTAGIGMKAHMLSTAALAERAGTEPTLVAAALLHDIGHFRVDYPPDAKDDDHRLMLRAEVDRGHETVGAAFLAGHFPPAVTEPIRLHVAAKKYLCAVETGYYDSLSGTTKHTLRLQGGPMTAQQAARFDAEPYARAAVQLRRWDDAALHSDGGMPGFEHYRPLLTALLVG